MFKHHADPMVEGVGSLEDPFLDPSAVDFFCQKELPAIIERSGDVSAFGFPQCVGSGAITTG